VKPLEIDEGALDMDTDSSLYEAVRDAGCDAMMERLSVAVASLPLDFVTMRNREHR